MSFSPSQYQLNIFNTYNNTNQNIVIKAVPGSGKTTTLEKLTNLVKPSKQVKFFAFNKSIVEELKERIVKPNIDISTLHSAGLSCIFSNLKFRKKIQDKKSYIFINSLNNYKWKLEKKEFNRLVWNLTNLWDIYRLNLLKNEDTDILASLAYEKGIDLTPELLSYFNDFKLMVNKHNKGIGVKELLIDFLDMIYLPVSLNLPFIKYDEVFIDECQDLNLLQQEIVKRSIKENGRFVAVGDPNQSIYSFLGADIKAFQKLESIQNTISLPLSVSYRCGKNIVNKANEIYNTIEAAEFNSEGKIYEDSFMTINEGDFVLCRENKPIIELYLALLKLGKKAVIKGKEIGEDLLAFIDKSATYEEFQTESNTKLLELESKLLAKGVKNPRLSKPYITLSEKVQIIEILHEYFESFYLVKEELGKMFNDKDKTSIQLMTIHKSKGLEANKVFILRNDLLPSQYAELPWEIEQEKNLQYVAFTRAKEELVFINDITKEFKSRHLKNILENAK